MASVVNDFNNTADASDEYPLGVTNVQWTVTDIHGNTNTCTQVVTVTDEEDPVINCAAPQTQTADAGVCEASVTVTAPSATDNNGVASIVNDYTGTNDASGVYPVGTTTVTWTVTDNDGNTSQCTQDITVTDDQAPAITCAAPVNQPADAGVCEAVVTVTAPTTSDNCGVKTVTNDFNNTADASGTYPVGTTTVVWTVTDVHGNTNTCTQEITVTDDQLPVITAGDNITQTADEGICGAMISITPATATDNCSVTAPEGTRDDGQALDAEYPVGTTTITWTATDIHGNDAVAVEQTVTITDDEAPAITCSGAVNQPADTGENFATVSVTAPTTSDNCEVASVVNDFNNTADASDEYPLGVTTVQWTVTDIHGNTNTVPR